jgi:hypothetical protein
MAINQLPVEEFEAFWLRSDRDERFRYRINRGVVRLYSFLFGLFWVAYILTIWGKTLTLMLGIVGVLVGLVSVFVIYNMLYWRHYARVSGIVITDKNLIWRNGRTAWSILWRDIDFESSGLTDHAIGSQAVEYYLSIDGKRLDVTRMHVEMPRIREFMAVFLQQMIKHGQLQGQASPKKF